MGSFRSMLSKSLSSLKLYPLFLLAVILVSCSGASGRKGEYHLTHEILWSDSMMTEDVFLGLPVSMLCHEGKLVILDGRNSRYLHLFDLEQKKSVGFYGKRGLGPNDFVSLLSLSSQDGSLYAYDLTRVRLHKLNLSPENGNLSVVKSYDFGKDWHETVIPLNNGLFLTQGSYEQGMFKLLNEKGELLSTSSDYPFTDADKGIPNINRSMAYQGKLSFNGKDRIVFVTSHARERFVFRVEGNTLVEESKVIETYPDYVDKSGFGAYSVAFKKENPFGYTDVFAAEDGYYVSYSGVDATAPDYGRSRVVERYSYSGDLECTYRLDVPISIFTVDEKKGMLYAITYNPQPELVCFDLK